MNKFKVGNHVKILPKSEYYETQGFDSFRRCRTFLITEIIGPEFEEEYVCQCISDDYTNTYEDHDLFKVQPAQYNKRKLNF